MRDNDIFDARNVAARWSSVTRHTVAVGYSRWLGHLNQRGQLKGHPADRVTPDVVADYVEHLKSTVRPTTVYNYVRHLCDAVRAMAPDQDWRWLRSIVTDLGHGLLATRRFKPVIPAEKFRALGFDLMGRADDGAGLKNVERAITYRDGLMIALLATRPLRRKNFANLRLDKHLTKAGGRWSLQIPAEETKGGHPFEAGLPHELDRPMDRYIRVYRPRILGLSGRNYLWTSQTGKPLKNGGVYAAIARRTRDAFGLSYGPQDFRVSAATTIAISDPANIHTASLVLGHIYEGTTEKWYNRARTIDASRRYQIHLDALRTRLHVMSG